MSEQVNVAQMSADTLRRPMRIGTVISCSWRHYCSHFSRYLPLSLRGTAWLLLPTVILLVGLLWMRRQRLILHDFSGLAALLIPAWAVLFLWCVAQALGEFAGISRAVHQSLSEPFRELEATTTESISTSRRFAYSRRFSLLASEAIKYGILGTVSVVFSIVFTTAFVVMMVGVGLFGNASQPMLFWAGGCTIILSSLLFVFLYAWLFLRLLITEQLLVTEDSSGAIISIGQSWKLMNQNLLRSLGAVLLAFLITLPVALTTGVLAQVAHPILVENVGIITAQNDVMFEDLLPFATSYLVGQVFSLLGGIVVAPFYRTVLTTLFFDIKNRRQGVEV